MRERVRVAMATDEQYFETGAWSCDVECCVCLESVTCFRRACCGAAVCDRCLRAHLGVRLLEGHLRMSCPATQCDKNLVRAEILSLLSEEEREKYTRFLEAANQNSCRKTCPRCCEMTEVR